MCCAVIVVYMDVHKCIHRVQIHRHVNTFSPSFYALRLPPWPENEGSQDSIPPPQYHAIRTRWQQAIILLYKSMNSGLEISRPPC